MDQNQGFEGYVTGSNKGGLLVNVEGVNAFVPLSQIVSGPDRSSPEATQRALTDWVGRNITLKVIELNRRRNRAILSERAAVQEKRAAEKERLLQELQEGDVKTGRITSIRDFGIFVDIGGADGLVHLSELSWERTPKSPHDLFKVGDEVPVYVLKVDNETKKIALSVRRAQPERWEEIVSRYREGQIVPGQITKLAPFGAFVRLEGPIEGLIHISELVDRRITHPKEVVEEGDVVPVKIVRIEYDRHRLGLSLRQARDRAEEDGWSFTDSGSPTGAPQDALDRLGVDAVPSREPADDAAASSEAEQAAAGAEEGTDTAEAMEQQTSAEAGAVQESEAATEPVAAVEPEAVAEPEAAEETEAVAEAVAAEEPVAVAEPEAEEETEAVAEAEAAEEPVAVAEAEAAEEPVAAAEPEAGEEPEATEPDAVEEPEAVAEAGAAGETDAAEPEASEEPETADEPEPVEENAADAEGEQAATEEAGNVEAAESDDSATQPDVTDESPEALNKVDES
jgi:predicted RNA-binding protein with RPS1 domain